MADSRAWVLFGGAGFIGLHLAEYLLESGCAGTVVIADIAPPAPSQRSPWLRDAVRQGRLIELVVDVREPIRHAQLEGGAAVAVNLAAIHREPGHAAHEYFTTNVLGAEQIAAWAARTGTQQLVFTSSISVYGNTRDGVDERSMPLPETPYGISKLIAEYVLRRWCAAAQGRRLAVIRPAVVFGPGEGGNVTKLVRAVTRGRFVFTGNRGVPKAAGYVRDLCALVVWMVERAGAESECIVNFALPSVPTVGDFVTAIQVTSGRRRVIPDLPYGLVYAAATAIGSLSDLGVRSPIHPRRVQKLIWATDVRPRYLLDHCFPFSFTLEQGLADWRRRAPHEWA